ncbi:MAG: hypothetical protein HQL37_08695 [Alphaproteobacteria bacterium]|nr:hypothetical protein [Alphaproteobacteria bacterium]
MRTNDIMPDGGSHTLWVDGNPSKFLQGHNIFGSDDLIGLVYALMIRLCDILPELEPTELDMHHWITGNYSLSRIDVAAMYSAESRAGALAWLRSAESASHMKHRGCGIMKGMTLYNPYPSKTGWAEASENFLLRDAPLSMWPMTSSS